MPPSPPLSRHLPAVLLWAGMAACAIGLLVHRLCQALPFPRFFEHLLLALLALLAAWPLQHWLGWSRAAALGLLWLLALAVFAGPLPLLAFAGTSQDRKHLQLRLFDSQRGCAFFHPVISSRRNETCVR